MHRAVMRPRLPAIWSIGCVCDCGDGWQRVGTTAFRLIAVLNIRPAVIELLLRARIQPCGVALIDRIPTPKAVDVEPPTNPNRVSCGELPARRIVVPIPPVHQA